MRSMQPPPVVAACAVLSALVAALAAAGDTCAVGDPACRGPEGGRQGATSASPYFWPMAMGHPGYYSNPPWPGPTNLSSSFSWEWFGPTGTRFEDGFLGPVIDDEKNIYVNGQNHVYKLDEHGSLLWTYTMPATSTGDAPAILDGRLHAATMEGHVFSVDMRTGAETWVTKAFDGAPAHHCQLAAHEGVVVSKGNQHCFNLPFPSCGAAAFSGLNGTDGAVLWTYVAGEALWDTFPQFPDDESVIFMDATGMLHRLHLQSGALIWKAGGTPNSWTDGSQFVASNGLTYSVEVDFTRCPPHQAGVMTSCPGFLAAHRTSDGGQVWRVTVPKPPNCSPVVGRLGDGEGLALVMPIGQQGGKCHHPAAPWYFWLGQGSETVALLAFVALHTLTMWLGKDHSWLLWGRRTRTHDVLAYEADTGEPLWTWSGPTDDFSMAPGDLDGFPARFKKGIRLTACPTPWSQPRIGPDGTIYVGNENGDLYALRDADGDRRIDDATEVSVHRTGATFGHQGTAHAPGMVVGVTFDGVHVWKS